MLVSDFDFFLPPELIAQQPADRRDASRLMVADRSERRITHHTFSDIPSLFRAGDLLVVNDARVIPARLLGQKETGGKTEVFLVSKAAGGAESWICLIKSSKPPRPGVRVVFPKGRVGTLLRPEGAGLWEVEFSPASGFEAWLEEVGSMPLPPYIRRDADDNDRERYQTVFARTKGAVAAPTAGLHFTDRLLDDLARRGVEQAPVTLHVGLGTFLPIRVDDPREHAMHRERYHIPEATAAAIERTRSAGGRIVAVGTTTTRALEHAASTGALGPGAGVADNMILPGHRFRVIDGLITNFHLPKSTLLLLVAAFAGEEFILEAYRAAVAERYRFYSYGDAMFIR